jgi:1-pyrroline-5-carboxylate dehydrogenase
MNYPFHNEPLTDFTVRENVEVFRDALHRVQSRLGEHYPLVIDGEAVYTEETFDSTNPANPSQVIGRVSKATPELADRAVRAAANAFEHWREVPYDERARYLFSAANAMRARKHEFSALMVLEVGKSWAEADGDTAEAIDFLEFYGREMLRLGPAQPTLPCSDCDNLLYYIPLGVGAVIAPWNFPDSIATGMTSATIVAGNTAVLKPASASPVVAAWMARLFNDDLHLPPGVLNYLPGPGSLVGDALVDHHLTRFIAFTGSKEVGLHIFERAARPQPGQRWLKRTILEMGGKDAILVDETADLDSAAAGIVTSAFGYSGQKCSACSRVIVVADVYDRLLDKVTALTAALEVGDPATGPEIAVGPVVDAAALRKQLAYIEIGRGEGSLVCGGEPILQPSGGYFLQPTIFADVDPDARLAQEEIFGPVLAVIRAKDFAEGLAVANNTDYGLTGGVYSQRRDRLQRARREFHVGNLYFNRKITGALVGIEPFGGFNMSGTDSKAGGSDYLLLFTQAKVVSERL